MATTKQLLARLRGIAKRRDAIQYGEMKKKQRAYAKRLEAEYAAELAALKRSDELTRRELISCNPYKVGDQIALMQIDGIVSPPMYQVTAIRDHERVFARRITSRGRLGNFVDQLRVDPSTHKKVKTRERIATGSR